MPQLNRQDAKGAERHPQISQITQINSKDLEKGRPCHNQFAHRLKRLLVAFESVNLRNLRMSLGALGG